MIVFNKTHLHYLFISISFEEGERKEAGSGTSNRRRPSRGPAPSLRDGVPLHGHVIRVGRTGSSVAARTAPPCTGRLMSQPHLAPAKMNPVLMKPILQPRTLRIQYITLARLELDPTCKAGECIILIAHVSNPILIRIAKLQPNPDSNCKP